MTCSDGTSTYVLGTTAPKFVPIGLVRQGHTVTQVIITGLTFHDSDWVLLGPCGAFTKRKILEIIIASRDLQRCVSYGGPRLPRLCEGKTWGNVTLRAQRCCQTYGAKVCVRFDCHGISVGQCLQWSSFRTSQQVSQQVSCSGTISQP